jgi:hypothetical protein
MCGVWCVGGGGAGRRGRCVGRSVLGVVVRFGQQRRADPLRIPSGPRTFRRPKKREKRWGERKRCMLVQDERRKALAPTSGIDCHLFFFHTLDRSIDRSIQAHWWVHIIMGDVKQTRIPPEGASSAPNVRSSAWRTDGRGIGNFCSSLLRSCFSLSSTWRVVRRG